MHAYMTVIDIIAWGWYILPEAVIDHQTFTRASDKPCPLDVPIVTLPRINQNTVHMIMLIILDADMGKMGAKLCICNSKGISPQAP